MILWIDAQLPPSIAAWIAATFGIETYSVRYLGLRDAKDNFVFQSARAAEAVVMTKDSDFVDLVRRLGAPPSVLWIRSGNTSNASLRETLLRELPAAMNQLEGGERIVEIGAAS